MNHFVFPLGLNNGDPDVEVLSVDKNPNHVATGTLERD